MRSSFWQSLLIVVVGATLFIVTLGAGGNTQVNSSRLVGAEACGRCHTEAYAAWKKSAHAKARQALQGRDKDNPTCLSCHTADPDDDDPALQGVQCETCHGAGRYYRLRHVMRDRELRQALGFETPDEKLCRRCHNDSAPSIAPFDLSKKLMAIKHHDPLSQRARGQAADADAATSAKQK